MTLLAIIAPASIAALTVSDPLKLAIEGCKRLFTAATGPRVDCAGALIPRKTVPNVQAIAPPLAALECPNTAMKRFRTAAVLLAWIVLLLSVSDASAAGSKLSTAPPEQMPTQTSQSAAPATSQALPRTGMDVGIEALFAAMLLAGGTAFRAASRATAS
jgi:hypothetical protein